MDILTTLGINSTLWTQLILFVVSYLLLAKLVFEPYMKAYHYRQNQTVGGEEEAATLVEKAKEMHLEFETHARQINEQIRTIFDKARAEAGHQYDELVSTARGEAERLTKSNAEKLAGQVKSAREGVQSEIPSLSAAIAERLLGGKS